VWSGCPNIPAMSWPLAKALKSGISSRASQVGHLKSGLSNLASQGREASHGVGLWRRAIECGHGVWPRSVAMVLVNQASRSPSRG